MKSTKKTLMTEENVNVYSNFSKENGLQDVAMVRKRPREERKCQYRETKSKREGQKCETL